MHSVRKSPYIKISYSLRGQKRQDNAFLIIVPNVFWLRRADALKFTHCHSWKQRQNIKPLKLWERRDGCCSKYFLESVSKAAHQMFSLARRVLQHKYLEQIVSCKERTHGHGHTNQIPWVNICLADSSCCLMSPVVSFGMKTISHSGQLPQHSAWSVPCMQGKSWGHHKCQSPFRWLDGSDVCWQLPTEHT